MKGDENQPASRLPGPSRREETNARVQKYTALSANSALSNVLPFFLSFSASPRLCGEFSFSGQSRA
jgi:hypothetical protein